MTKHLAQDNLLIPGLTLKGFTVDQTNLTMAAAAFNFKKWMREVTFWLDKLKPTKIGLEIIFLRHNMMAA